MVRDEEVSKAVSRILQRSERQEDLPKLLGTFVDVGVLPQLNNRNNHVFYGRRGTGKTHVLRVLGSTLQQDPSNVVVYIDARVLGSTVQFSDHNVSLGRRCLALFKDFLSEVYNDLLEYIVENDMADALEELDALREAVSDPYDKVDSEAIEISSKETSGRDSSIGARLGANDLGVRAEASGKRETTEARKRTYEVSHEDKVVFPALHTQLTRVLERADATLYVLFDEWSSLPAAVQPYLAEFIKRGLLPIQRAVIKIASLEYRSHFTQFIDDTELGFQLGADIAVTQDLDDYFVFDRNPDQITSAYASVLYKHLASELPDDYLSQEFGVNSGKDLASRLFTERKTFAELARASEGVIRDLINIFTSAFFNALRRDRQTIDRKAIIEAARQWFEQDKASFLDEELHTVLRRIVDEVIGARRARSFLLPRQLEKHPTIQRLFDARVLHQMQRGYADKDNPGVRYNIYSLDYGTYVDLLGTLKQPEIALSESTDDEETIVPFDDKRSIRRIVLDESVLLVNA